MFQMAKIQKYLFLGKVTTTVTVEHMNRQNCQLFLTWNYHSQQNKNAWKFKETDRISFSSVAVNSDSKYLIAKLA